MATELIYLKKRTYLNKLNEFVLDYYNIWGNHYDL